MRATATRLTAQRWRTGLSPPRGPWKRTHPSCSSLAALTLLLQPQHGLQTSHTSRPQRPRHRRVPRTPRGRKRNLASSRSRNRRGRTRGLTPVHTWLRRCRRSVRRRRARSARRLSSRRARRGRTARPRHRHRRGLRSARRARRGRTARPRHRYRCGLLDGIPFGSISGTSTRTS